MIRVSQKIESSKTRNLVFDILKYVAAFFVVTIHFPIYPNITAFARFAVPCFFILNGYFLYNKTKLAGGGF